VAGYKCKSVAIRAFYDSKTYEMLSDNDTLLWQKTWQDIYEMCKEELSKHPKLIQSKV
jgi:hypothetical protein